MSANGPHPFFRDLQYSRRRENIRLRDRKKYNDTLSACSCQKFKPQPIFLKLWADKAVFNQITCSNSLLYVPPTYFTHLHLLMSQHITESEIQLRIFFIWVWSCLYTHTHIKFWKKSHLKQSRSVKPLFYYLIFSLISNHSALSITLVLCFHRLGWNREFVLPFHSSFPFSFSFCYNNIFLHSTNRISREIRTHKYTQVHMCGLWSVSLAERECVLSVCQAPGQS